LLNRKRPPHSTLRCGRGGPSVRSRSSPPDRSCGGRSASSQRQQQRPSPCLRICKRLSAFRHLFKRDPVGLDLVHLCNWSSNLCAEWFVEVRKWSTWSAGWSRARS